MGAGWAAASQAVEQEVAVWRRAPPRAILTEIEQEVETATRPLTRWLVEELAGADTPALRAWLAELVLAALRALPATQAGDRRHAQELCDETLAYLEARIPQLRDTAFQARGLPIGSGVVESANKVVVEARLKGSGMHWDPANVSPMVALRACRRSGRWAEDWPAILHQLRQQEASRRETRRLRCHPPPPPPAPPDLRLLRSAARKMTARRAHPTPKKRAD